MEKERRTIEELERIIGVGYSAEQRDIVESKGGLCVIACAGAGKTTVVTHTLVRRLKDRETMGSRVLGLTFSNTAADEMSGRLGELLEQMGVKSVVKVQTVHSFCLSLLTQARKLDGIRTITDNKKREIIQQVGLEGEWKYEYGDKIIGLLTLQTGKLMREANFVESEEFIQEGIDKEIYKRVVGGYREYKKKYNYIDFDDMLLSAYHLLVNNTYYGNICVDKYKCVVVDEAQDMSRLQYEIVLRVLGKGALSPEEHVKHVRDSLLLVGDDDQCIYEWSGSEPQEMLNVQRSYNLELKQLSTNYRCPEVVLSKASKGIAYNSHSIDKTMLAHKQEGKLEYVRVRGGGYAGESRYVAEQIEELLVRGVEPEDIVVLGRNATHLSVVWLYLTSKGIKTRTYGGNKEGITPLMRHINKSMNLYSSLRGSGEVLYSIIGGTKTSSEELANTLALVDGCNFLDWAEYVVCTYGYGHGLAIREDNVYKNANKAWRANMLDYYKAGGLSRAPEAMNNLYRLVQAGKQGEIEFYREMLLIYSTMMSWKYKGLDDRRIYKGVLLALHDLLGDESSMEFVRNLESYEAPETNYVTLSTVHSAKGREWVYEYMVANDSLTYPLKSVVDRLKLLGMVEAMEKYIEGERRVHYVGLTRTKHQLVIVGGDLGTSRFLKEAGIEGGKEERTDLREEVLGIKEEEEAKEETEKKKKRGRVVKKAESKSVDDEFDTLFE